MARECEICGKATQRGNQVETRGKAKYLGGVGTKVTGISRREFRANLQSVKVTTPNGSTQRVRVCTRCLKSGFVRKAVQQKPFKLAPTDAAKAKAAKAKAPQAKSEGKSKNEGKSKAKTKA